MADADQCWAVFLCSWTQSSGVFSTEQQSNKSPAPHCSSSLSICIVCGTVSAKQSSLSRLTLPALSIYLIRKLSPNNKPMLFIQWNCFCFLWSFLICIGSQIDPFPTVKHLYCKRREAKSAKGCSLVCLFSKFDTDYINTEVKVGSRQLTESSRNYAVCRIIYFMIMHIMLSVLLWFLVGFTLGYNLKADEFTVVYDRWLVFSSQFFSKAKQLAKSNLNPCEIWIAAQQVIMAWHRVCFKA